jgi:phosphoglycolate phosphatase
MFARLGVHSENVKAHVQAYKAHYRTVHTQQTRLLPDARQAVESASALAHLGIVTTKTTRYSIELMEHFGLMSSFGVLIGRDDVTYPKPHPEPILKALQTLPSVTGAAYMVGDTCIDMEAAHASNTIGMGVLCGYGTRASLEKCADYLASNALQAVQYIAKG